MTLALIADLHGNWPATQAVAEDLQRRGITQVYCLGDLVGKGPESHKTCDWAREHCQVILCGNWDVGIARKRFPNDSFYWDQLGPERMAFLAALPKEHLFTFAGMKFRLIHGRPVMPQLLFSHSEADAFKPYLEGVDVFGYADSHRPAFRTLNGGYLFNTGSVGNSLGVNKAHYMILTEQPSGVDFTCVSLHYDNALAARIAENTPGLPGKDAYIREVTTGIYSR
ncbi:MAG: metallophosphoesterase family protein [Clostridia bacterium]|nr:metallophosphoesterase family protein [Clostridia bacterium]